MKFVWKAATRRDVFKSNVVLAISSLLMGNRSISSTFEDNDPVEQGQKDDKDPTDNVYTDLTTLKTAPTTNRSYRLVKNGVGVNFYYETANAPYTADDLNVIKLDDVPLSVGALVRQKADSIIVQRSPGLVRRPVSDKLSDFRTVRDFGLGGAIGNNTPVELNTVFPNLAAAQALYPHVTNLTDTLDWAAIQACLDDAAIDVNQRGLALLNEGYWNISRALQLPNHVSFEGQGKGSWLNNQTYPLVGPQIVNAEAEDFNFASIKNMCMVGGDYALKIDTKSGVDGLVMEDVSCILQTITNINVNKLLQTSVFNRVTLGDAVTGLNVDTPTTNAVAFNDCQFVRHTGTSLRLQTCEAVVLNNPRFEHGDADRQSPMIDLDNAKAFQIKGGYIEGGQQQFLLETNSNDQVFIGGGIHFTYALDNVGDPVAYFMESDGIVGIGDGHVTTGGIAPGYVTAPAKIFLSGNGDMLSGNSEVWLNRSKRGGRVKSKTSAPPSGTAIDVLGFARPVGAINNVNFQEVTGILIVSLGYFDGEGVARNISRIYQVRCAAVSDTAMSVFTNQISALDNIDGATTLTLQQKAGATATDVKLEAVFAGINTGFDRLLTFEFDFTKSSQNNTAIVEVAMLA